MKIRGSVVSLSFIFAHPPEDKKKEVELISPPYYTQHKQFFVPMPPDSGQSSLVTNYKIRDALQPGAVKLFGRAMPNAINARAEYVQASTPGNEEKKQKRAEREETRYTSKHTR